MPEFVVRSLSANGEDVCLFYDLTLSGATIFGCGWYEVRGGKINSLEVIFDPRPVLARKAA